VPVFAVLVAATGRSGVVPELATVGDARSAAVLLAVRVFETENGDSSSVAPLPPLDVGSDPAVA
jgi:hypothetical protein